MRPRAVRTTAALALPSFLFLLLASIGVAGSASADTPMELKENAITVMNAHLFTFYLSGKNRTGYDPYATFFDSEDKLQTESTAMALYYGGVENLGLTPTQLQEIYDFFSYMKAPDGWLYSDYTAAESREFKKALHNAWSLIAIEILEGEGITDSDNLKQGIVNVLEDAIDSNGYMGGDPDGHEGLRTKFIQSLPFMLKAAQDLGDTGAIAKARLAIDFYMANCIDGGINGSYDVHRIDASGTKTTLINTHEVMEFAHGLLLFHDYETNATRKTTIQNNLIGILNRYKGSAWTYTNSFGEKYVSDSGSAGTVNSLAQFQFQYVTAEAEQRGWVTAGTAVQYLDIAGRTKMTGTSDPQRDNNYFYRHDSDTGAQSDANINSYLPGYAIFAIDTQYATISGTVLDSGSPLAGVAVSANNGGGSDSTDGSGDYAVLVPNDWTGTVTPTLAPYTMTPTSRAYANVTADDPDEDYTTSNAVCGNSILETGEQCDDGNTTDGDCCSSVCSFESSATVCRTSAGTCDVAETCTGSTGTCPTDSFESAANECRASAGVCDVAETCTGSSALCPGDGFASGGTECRAVAGDCDVAESCSGGDAACPADGYEPPTTTCRASTGVCDASELCTGSDPSCPADEVFDGVPCADGDVCNGDEMCVSGVCTPGSILECDDGDACTADSCDAVSGCGYAPIEPCTAVPATSVWGQLMLAMGVSGFGALALAWRRQTIS